MRVESKRLPTLFRQSLLGMFKLLRPIGHGKHVQRSVTIRSSDLSTLLIDFLNEALALAHANKETYASVRFKTLSPNFLEAQLEGYRISSFHNDIKAVTYHEAKVEKDAKNVWYAHIVFDI